MTRVTKSEPLFDENGAVLDGRNRLEILTAAGEVPWTQTVPGCADWTIDQKKAFTLSRNFKRRNLSPDQKAEVRDKMKGVAWELRRADPGAWTQQRIANEFGVDQTTVSKWEAEWSDEAMHNMKGHTVHNSPSKKKDKPDSRTRLTKEGKETVIRRVQAGESQTQIAADFGVNQATISRAVKAHLGRQNRHRKAVAEAKAASQPATVTCASWDAWLPDQPMCDLLLAYPPCAYVSLPDRDAAQDWIDANQLGRRNLAPDQMSFLRGRRYNRAKKAQGAPTGNANAKQTGQNVQIDSVTTAETLASQYGVDERTIRRDGQVHGIR